MQWRDFNFSMFDWYYFFLFLALKDFLAKAEKKFDNLGPIGSDIDKVKKQIGELKEFKDEVDPWMIKVEALNRYVNFI